MRRILVVLFCLLVCTCQKQENPEPAGRSEPAISASGPAYPEMQLVKGMRPPFSTSAQRFQWAAAVHLTQQELKVEGNPMVRLQDGKFPESALDPNDQRIVALDRILKKFKELSAEAPDSNGAEYKLALVVDRDIPFARVHQVMRTAALADFPLFRLVTLGPSAEAEKKWVATVQVSFPVSCEPGKYRKEVPCLPPVPSSGNPPKRSPKDEPLTVFLAKDKIRLTHGAAEPVEIPLKEKSYDMAALSTAAQKLHASNPDRDLATVVVGADAMELLSYQTAVSVLDAIREVVPEKGPRKKLFGRIMMTTEIR